MISYGKVLACYVYLFCLHVRCFLQYLHTNSCMACWLACFFVTNLIVQKIRFEFTQIKVVEVSGKHKIYTTHSNAWVA